jgi:hypothetical protein
MLLLTFPCIAHATLCAELESVRPGDYLHGQTETFLSTSTRRPSSEPSSVGQSAVKGAMARRISGELGGATVRWSSATLIGPITCATFNAYLILVDPVNVRIVGLEPRFTPQ